MNKSTLKGRLFDIRRFSTHDGAGLRTTVFFKGCPLNCAWCQNPEGIAPCSSPIYFESKCIHCGTCLKLSENGGVSLDNGQIRLNKERSDCWDRIIYNCPADAIAMDSREWTVGEVVREVEKDLVFFNRGGGVTLSGGEPLLQSDFAAELLCQLQERGIHTAIETSLLTSSENLKKVLPYLDQIFADMKIADSMQHKAATGLGNGRIKENMRVLLQSDKRDAVTIRTPLIPQYTATEKNLTEIAHFLSDLYPEVRYELLNYNPLAEAKYHLVGKEYCFTENPKLYSKIQMEAFGDIVKRNGIKHLIMEI